MAYDITRRCYGNECEVISLPHKRGWGLGSAGTGITGGDTAVTCPRPPHRPCRSWGSAVRRGRTKLCLLFAGEGRRQRSRWESFPYDQTTRQLIRGVSPVTVSPGPIRAGRKNHIYEPLTTPGVQAPSLGKQAKRNSQCNTAVSPGHIPAGFVTAAVLSVGNEL